MHIRNWETKYCKWILLTFSTLFRSKVMKLIFFKIHSFTKMRQKVCLSQQNNRMKALQNGQKILKALSCIPFAFAGSCSCEARHEDLKKAPERKERDDRNLFGPKGTETGTETRTGTAMGMQLCLAKAKSGAKGSRKVGKKDAQGCRRHGIKFTLKDMDSFSRPILVTLSLAVNNTKRFHFIWNFKVQGRKWLQFFWGKNKTQIRIFYDFF